MSKQKKLELIERIKEIGIVPVVKLDDPKKALPLASALLAGGINCAEITFRAQNAEKVIADIRKEYPNMIVGAGTVLSIEQAKLAIEAGAQFIVAPGFNPKIAEFLSQHDILYIPGVSSASEIEQVMEYGLRHVKFFPAVQAGGLDYIKALSAPYSDMYFMPTGGINIDNINEYLMFNKIFACGGSWMVNNELIRNNEFDEITRLCTLTIKKILGFELAHVGINEANSNRALALASMFQTAFGFESKETNRSIFLGDSIEIMKVKAKGEFGHIAIQTNFLSRAIAYLSAHNFKVDEEEKQFDQQGKLVSVYLKDVFGGFAVHLVRKSDL